MGRLRSPQWIATLPESDRDAISGRMRLVQSWVAAFARELGKRRVPKVRIAESYTHYAPWTNVLAIPARTLRDMDERLLRVVVAHEFGHSSRRWMSLLSRSVLARLEEEMLADRMAMRLTGATIEDLEEAIIAAAGLEGGWEGQDLGGAALREYLDFRWQLQKIKWR